MDIEIRIIRRNGKWRVRISGGAIPKLFTTFEEAVAEAKLFIT